MCGKALLAMNNAAHSATTLPSTRTGAPASKLRRIANIAPVQETAGARNIATGAPKPVHSAYSAGYDAANASMGSQDWAQVWTQDWINGAANLMVPSTISVRAESTTIAESAVMRAAGGTKHAVTTSAIASQATTALSP